MLVRSTNNYQNSSRVKWPLFAGAMQNAQHVLQYEVNTTQHNSPQLKQRQVCGCMATHECCHILPPRTVASSFFFNVIISHTLYGSLGSKPCTRGITTGNGQHFTNNAKCAL